MSEETVLVTGAGGFVGGRLAQRMALSRPERVRPLVHRGYGPGTMRLARLPLDIEEGSVMDAERMREVMAGCDAVVHCAVGGRETIIDGTHNVLEAAIEEGVETFVHLSSASVHGHDIEGIIREESPANPDTPYARWKWKVERDIADRVEGEALSPTIFRPYIVYGPHSEFVIEPLETVQEGAVLADGGEGSINQIYVDNLVDAILLALDRPAARGETFLLADDDPVSWREYYEALGGILDEHPPFREASRRRIRAQNALQYAADNVIPPITLLERIATSDDVREAVVSETRRMPWVMGLYARLPTFVQESVQSRLVGESTPTTTVRTNGQGTEEADYDPPSLRYARMHSSHGTVSNRKAKEVLGWEQRVRFDEAMELIGAWVEYEELA